MNGVGIPQPIGRPRKRPHSTACDKAYGCKRIRQWFRDHGIKAVIPHKENERARTDGRTHFDKAAYRCRSMIENVIGWLKESRRIGTRYEKLAINFLAMLKLAMIERCMRKAFSDRA